MILGLHHHIPAQCFIEIDKAVSQLTHRTVVFNAHNYPSFVPKNSIIFNLENVPEQANPALWAEHEIWDASLRNISHYPSGLKVTHVPMGYEPSMRRFEKRPLQDCDIDVVFCGFINDRRMAILNDLRNRGLRVAIPSYNCWGKERDDVIARSKIALDMRYYEDGIFPTLRSLHLIANRVPVVAETSLEMPPWVMENVPYNMLANRVETVLKNERTINDLATEAENILKKHPLQLPDEPQRQIP